MRIVGGSVFDGEEFAIRDIVIDRGKFVETIGEALADQETIDAVGCYVIPGLVDVHFFMVAAVPTFAMARMKLFQLSGDMRRSVA